jgi:IclR family transcriptional regulator, acetate operon repressor
MKAVLLQDRDEGRGRVRAVKRALCLLERLSLSARPLQLHELARLEGLPPATCLRLLTTMQERGFVRFDPRTHTWTVGATTLYVSANFAATRDIVRFTEPIACQLSRERGVTVNLGVLDTHDVTVLYRVTSGKPASVPAPQRIPAHCSAIGKAVLSGLPPVEAHALVAGAHLMRVTRNSIVNPHSLFDHLERAQRMGYAVDNEENTNGLRCVAAPMFDQYHRPVAAISIAAPVEALYLERLASYGRELMSAADRIMRRFGGRRPQGSGTKFDDAISIT